MKYNLLILSFVGILGGIAQLVASFLNNFEPGRMALGLVFLAIHGAVFVMSITLINSGE